MTIFYPIVQSILLIVLWLGLAACQQSRSDTVSQTSNSADRKETQLTLNNAVWQQSNQEDNTVWKIQAKNAVYSKDKQTALLETVTGNLLQDDKIILQLSAERGEVRDNGNLILLKDNIVATDPRNGGTIRSDEVEWQPTENLLSIRQNFRGDRNDIRLTASEGKYYTDTETLELQNNVVVTASEPSLQLNCDRLTWKIAQNVVNSEVTLKIVRYQDTAISDRLVADRGMVDFDNNTVTLAENIELIASNPSLQIATNFLIWDYQTRIIDTNKPIQIIDRDRQLNVTGNSGKVDFNRNIAHLKSGSKSINEKNSAQLYARELIWNLETEVVEAFDDIVYRQSEPAVKVTGNKAVGKLTDNSIVVSGGTGQVTSVIEDL